MHDSPTRSHKAKKHAVLPRAFAPVESVLGPLPLFEGEDGKACAQLLKNVRAAVRPPNFLIDLEVRDIVYHTWSIARYQRLEAELTKKLEDSEKVFRSDRLTELAITVQRLHRIQQLISTATNERYKALNRIERISTTFATTLRKAIAEAAAQSAEGQFNTSEV